MKKQFVDLFDSKKFGFNFFPALALIISECITCVLLYFYDVLRGRDININDFFTSDLFFWLVGAVFSALFFIIVVHLCRKDWVFIIVLPVNGFVFFILARLIISLCLNEPSGISESVFNPYYISNGLIYYFLLALLLVLFYRIMNKLFCSLLWAFIGTSVIALVLRIAKDFIFFSDKIDNIKYPYSFAFRLNIGVIGSHLVNALVLGILSGIFFYFGYFLYLKIKGCNILGKEIVASGHDAKEIARQIPRRFYFGLFFTGVVLSFLLYLLSIGIKHNHAESLLPLLWILSILGILLELFVGIKVIYKMWQSIQDGHAFTTPGKAVGFLFIPIFNLYWMFRVWWGFAKGYNELADRHRLNIPRLPAGLFLTQCILILLAAIPFVLPFIAYPVVMLSLAMFYMIIAAVNRIPIEIYKK